MKIPTLLRSRNALSLALVLAAALTHAATSTTPEQRGLITARAAVTGHAFDLEGVSETMENPSVLFVPSNGDPHLLLLFDTATKRAVVVEDAMPEEVRFQLVDLDRGPQVIHLQMDSGGVFGPKAELDALRISDATLAAWQDRTCMRQCEVSTVTCAACMGVGLLTSLRAPGSP